MTCPLKIYKLLLPCWVLITAFYSHAIERQRYYAGALVEGNDGYRLPLESDVSQVWFETRCAVTDNKEGREPSWSVLWKDGVRGDTISVVISWGNTAFATDYDVRYMRVKALRADSVLASAELTKDIDLYAGYNSLAVQIENKEASVYVGNRQLKHLFDFPVSGNPMGEAIVMCDKKMDVRWSYTKSKPDIGKYLRTDWTLDTLKSYIALSNDPMESFWTYLDRENDSEKAALGGRYTLASVKSDGGYDLIYISGAKTNRQNWNCGMKKGHLVPTAFADSYDLIWYDAMLDPMDGDDEANAYVGDQGMILTLNFPLLLARVRFAKVIGEIREVNRLNESRR